MEVWRKVTGWKKGRVGAVSAESGTKSTNVGAVPSSTGGDHGGKSGAVVLVNRAAC